MFYLCVNLAFLHNWHFIFPSQIAFHILCLFYSKYMTLYFWLICLHFLFNKIIIFHQSSLHIISFLMILQSYHTHKVNFIFPYWSVPTFSNTDTLENLIKELVSGGKNSMEYFLRGKRCPECFAYRCKKKSQ